MSQMGMHRGICCQDTFHNSHHIFSRINLKDRINCCWGCYVAGFLSEADTFSGRLQLTLVIEETLVDDAVLGFLQIDYEQRHLWIFDLTRAGYSQCSPPNCDPNAEERKIRYARESDRNHNEPLKLLRYHAGKNWDLCIHQALAVRYGVKRLNFRIHAFI